MFVTSALEHTAGVAQQGLLPFGDLRGVNLMPLGYLVDRLLFALRFQRYLALELSGKFTSLFHRLLLSYFFLATCPTLRGRLRGLSLYPRQFQPHQSSSHSPKSVQSDPYQS